MTDTRLGSTANGVLLALLALHVVTVPPLARAQVTTTGNIRVSATDQAGLPIPGASSPWRKSPLHSSGDPSRLTALLLGQICPIFSLVAPCQAGVSPLSVQRGVSPRAASVSAAAEDAATTRIGFTDAAGLTELRALNPSARYVVTVELAGFRTSRQAGVLVRAGQTVSLAVSLAVGSVTETVVVTAAPPVVDVTSAIVAEDITLDLIPTGRSYQSYLQLVPGVLPDDPDSPGNPASKSGLNYSDIGGDGVDVIRTVEQSQDQFYGRGTWAPSTDDTLASRS